MKRKLSAYEIQQVEEFILELHKEYALKLPLTDYIGESWIAYLEMRKEYKYAITGYWYWENVEKSILEHIDKLKKKRNMQLKIYSRLSLNKTYGTYKEEIGSLFCKNRGDFVNTIALWDYAKRLGPLKYAIIRMMSGGEDDSFIMRTMHLETGRYLEIKKELRDDFIKYKNM